MSLQEFFRSILTPLRKTNTASRRRRRWSAIERQVPVLESRLLLAAVTDAGDTLNIDLQQDEFLSVSTDGSAYTFSSNLNAVDGGVADASIFSGFGTATFTLDDLSAYTTVNITDIASEAAMRFQDSGGSTYQHDFNVEMLGDGTADSPVGFFGSSSFGDHSLDVMTDRSIHLFDGSSLSTENGNVTLAAANAGHENGPLRGVTMVNASITTTGSGNIVLDGAATNQGAALDFHHGISMQAGSKISSTSVAPNAGIISLTGTQVTGNQFNSGVLVSDASQITSVSGDIRVIGLGGAGAGEGNRGVYFSQASTITSTGTDEHAAKIYIEGHGGTTGTDRTDGVLFQDSEVRTVAGDVQVVGVGGTGTGNSNRGVTFSNSAIVSTGVGELAGQIVLDGTAGAGIDFNRGIVLGNTPISSIGGDILIKGTGGTPTGHSNRAIEIGTGTAISSTGTSSNAATITIDGRATSGESFSNGLTLNDVTLTSVAGDITITGVGANGSGASNNAIGFTDVSISSTGVGDLAAAIAVLGTAVSGTSFSGGLDLHRTTIRSVDGDISLTGRGGNTTGDSNRAVRIKEDSLIESTGTGPNAATITIDGLASGGTGFNDGIIIQQDSAVRSVDGDITITGVAGDNSESNISGVALIDAAITSSGVGSEAALITVNGTVGIGLNRSIGVYVRRTTFSSVDGDIDITGVGNGTGNDNRGIDILDNSTIESTGTTSNAATITLDGTGGDGGDYNNGIRLTDNVGVTAVIGDMLMTGRGGNGSGSSNDGIEFADGAVVSTIGGNITATGRGGDGGVDSNQGLNLESGIIESTGLSAAGKITVNGVGGNGVADNHGVKINHGFMVQSATADITISGTGGAGSGFRNRGVTIDGAIKSRGTGNDAADIRVFGTGGAGDSEAQGIAAFAEIESVDGDVQFVGVGGTVTGWRASGINITGGQIFTSGSGSIDLDGMGGTSEYFAYGVSIHGNQPAATPAIATAFGPIRISGVSGDRSMGSRGVDLNGFSVGLQHGNLRVIGQGHRLEDVAIVGTDTIRSSGDANIDIDGDTLTLTSEVGGAAATGDISFRTRYLEANTQKAAIETSGRVELSTGDEGFLNLAGDHAIRRTEAGITGVSGRMLILSDRLIVAAGAEPGSGSARHDRIHSDSTVNIGGTQLEMRWDPAWTPVPNAELVIIERNGGTGQFIDLPGGSVLPEFFNATINYFGGDGDDVSVTLPATLPTTRSILLRPGQIGTTVYGVDADDNAGQSVNSAGDVNNDGYDDFLIGASKADSVNNQRSNAGEVYLIYGGPNLPNSIDASNLGGAGVVISGAVANDQAGHFVDAADVNNDGFSDLIIGAHRSDDAATPGASVGGAYIVYGGDNLPATIDLASLGSAGVTIRGVDANDLAGNAVGAIGDINNDGFQDLAFGAIWADSVNNERSQAGEIHVVFGGNALPSTLNFSDPGVHGMTIYGAAAADELGVGIRRLGDVNGDDIDDVVITSWKAPAVGLISGGAGQSYILYGSTSFDTDLDLDESGTADVTIYGIDDGDLSGWGVSSGGDVNGDGINDFLIGASQADGPNNDHAFRGESYLILGSARLPNTINLEARRSGTITIYGAEEGDYSGRSIDIIGDVNGDGLDDIAIGARAADGVDGSLQSAGETSIVLGRESWPVAMDLAVPGTAAVTLHGSDAGDNSGFMVRAAGDVDGDGSPDLIIGDRFADSLNNSRANAGQAHLIYGDELFDPTPAPVILGPLNDASQFPVLEWSTVPGAVSYELWVGLIGDDANNPVISETTTLTSFSTIPNQVSLKYGQYRMWVRANFADGEKSEWAINVFAVNASTTVLDTPAFDGIETRPTFSWEGVDEAIGYRIFVNNLTTGESGVIDEIVTGTSYRPDDPLTLGRYRIWVRTVLIGNYQSSWSAGEDHDISPVAIGPVGAVIGEQQTFSWTPVAGAAAYQFYLVGPGGVLANESDITGTTFTPASPLPNGDFRWWIRGYTADGRAGSWSEPAQFSTGGRTNIFAPTFTAGSIPEFTWAAVPGATSYEIYLSEAGSSGALYRAAGISGTSFQSLPLNNGDYRVWVRSTLADGSSVWGKGVAFTVNELVSTVSTGPIQPTDSSFDTNPQFVWQRNDDARRYELYLLNVNANLAPAERSVLVEDIQQTNHTVQNLPAGEWTWWVRTRDNNNVPGPWSNPATFTNDGRIPLLSTGANLTGLPQISWIAVTGAARYALQVDNLTTGESQIIREDNLADPFFFGTVPLPAGTYRAWARAISPDDVLGPWSLQSDFTVA